MKEDPKVAIYRDLCIKYMAETYLISGWVRNLPPSIKLPGDIKALVTKVRGK